MDPSGSFLLNLPEKLSNRSIKILHDKLLSNTQMIQNCRVFIIFGKNSQKNTVFFPESPPYQA